MSDKPKHLLTKIALTQAQHERLTQIGKATGASLAFQVRAAVDAYLATESPKAIPENAFVEGYLHLHGKFQKAAYEILREGDTDFSPERAAERQKLSEELAHSKTRWALEDSGYVVPKNIKSMVSDLRAGVAKLQQLRDEKEQS